MGACLEAVIQHNLTADEIMSLDGFAIDPIFEGRMPAPLRWASPRINADFLVQSWNKISDSYVTNPWAGEDMPILKNDEIDVIVWTPHLLSVSPFFRPSFYRSDEVFRLKFNNIVSTIAKSIKAVDMIIIEDWYVYEAFDEHIGLTVAEIKNGVIAKNLPYFEIDLNQSS